MDDDQIAVLAAWIWENKPTIGCTYAEHPLSSMVVEDLWEICDPE